MEARSSSGAHRRQLVWSAWKFDTLMNSWWRRIFAKVKFIVFVSNILCINWVMFEL
jgi:hypothetical protein